MNTLRFLFGGFTGKIALIGAITIIVLIAWTIVAVMFPTDTVTSYQNGQVVTCSKAYGAKYYTCTYKDLDERGDVFTTPYPVANP